MKSLRTYCFKFIVCYLSFTLITCFAATYAQRKSPVQSEADLDAFIQSLFAVQDANINYEDAYEALYLYFTNPLNLNNATRAELASLYILTEKQIDSFFKHRKLNGDLLSIYELQAIQDFDNETITKLLPFVTVDETTFQQDNRPLLRKILEEPNNFLLFRQTSTLEQKEGYRPLTEGDTLANGSPKTRYAGSPNQLYVRYRVSHTKDFSLGFTMEKDAGERMTWNPQNRQYGFDFFSYHFAVFNRGRLKALALGDYQVQIGQGLLTSGGFYVGKGAETIATTRRSTLGIRPYTSVLEGGFFRGGAATYQFGKFDVTAFISNIKQDGNVQSVSADTLSEGDAFTNAIIRTGLHRTPREIASRNQINEFTSGANLTYRSKNNNLEMGVTALQTTFSAPVVPLDRLYNQFEFSGKINHNISFNYNYLWQNFNFFGEFARSKSGGVGLVNGFVATLTTKVEIAMLYRRFDRNFHTFYGNAFSENTRNINENGLYWGLKIKPNRRWTLSAYYDYFKFPWLRFLVDAPSTGYEFLARVSYQPTKTILLYAQFREETKGRNFEGNTARIDFVSPSTKRNYQLNADFKATDFLTLRSRVQWSTYQQEGGTQTNGYAIIQDLTYDKMRWKFSTRFALFDTDDFENRQYAFEKNVLYAFAVPAYSGVGFRNYYLVQYGISKKIDVWIRYAYTTYRNQQSISSGLEAISGNQKTDVHFQIRWKF
jgi:hypothetical protein